MNAHQQIQQGPAMGWPDTPVSPCLTPLATHKSIVNYPPIPPSPTGVEATGLKLDFIIDLVLKTLYLRGACLGSELADSLCLPYSTVVKHAMQFLREERMAEVRRGAGQFETQWEFVLTDKGIQRAREVMKYNGYVGPCPVPLTTYVQHVRANPVRWAGTTQVLLHEALSDLVVNDRLLHKLGPAFNSGKSMFLFGPPGNGKTSIAERLSRALSGCVLVPYALEASGQVVQLYDAAYHERVPTPGNSSDTRTTNDKRWIVCKRPFIIVGGELRLEHLELTYDNNLRYYTSPVQMKAIGGCFMVDDFGRQKVPPQHLLNRWIVPLEKNLDYHTLITGEQIAVPFEVLIIFSTNLEPRALVDEAFLRRIRHKIEIGDPSEAEFRAIFKNACQQLDVQFNEESLSYLVRKHYVEAERPFRAVHPRDLLQQLVDYCNYMNIEKKLSPELIDIACAAYLVKL